MSSEEETALGFGLEEVKVWFQCLECRGYLHSIPALKIHAARKHQVASQDVKLPDVLPSGAAGGKVFFDYLSPDWRSVSAAKSPVTNESPQRCSVRNVARLVQNSSREGGQESSRQQERDNLPDESGSVGGHSGVASVPDSGMFDGASSEPQEDEVPQHRTIVPPPMQNNESAEGASCQMPTETAGQGQSGKGFSCNLCHKTYKTKGVLNFHVRKVHAENQTSELTKDRGRDAETGNETESPLQEQRSPDLSSSPPLPPQESPISSAGESDSHEGSSRRGRKARKHAVTPPASYKGSDSASGTSKSANSTPELERLRRRRNRSAISKSSDSEASIPIRKRLRRKSNESGTSESSHSEYSTSLWAKLHRRQRNQPGTSKSPASEDSTPIRKRLRRRQRNEPGTSKSLDSEDSTPIRKRLRRRQRNEPGTSKSLDSEDSTPIRRRLRRRQRNEPGTSKSSVSEDSTPERRGLRRSQRNKLDTDRRTDSDSSSCMSFSSGSVKTKSTVETETVEEGELSDKSTTSEETALSASDLTDDRNEEEDSGKKKLTPGNSSDFEDIFTPITAKSQRKKPKRKAAAEGDVKSKSPTPERPGSTICNVCKLEFEDPSALVLHMKEAHKNGEPVGLRCGYCDKRYTSKSDFNQHILTHGNAQK